MFGFGKSATQPDTNTTDGDTTTPESTTTTDTELEGLDKWGNLFDNKDDNSKEGEGDDTPFNPLELLDNEEALGNLVSKLDLTSAISKETQAKLANNEPDALPSMLNEVGAKAYTQALKHSVAIANKLVEDKLARFDKSVSSKINSSINDREIASLIPEISNPIVAAGLNPYISQLRKQNPSASASDIASEVRNILKTLNTTVNPSDDNSGSKGKRSTEVEDWAAELGL